MKIQVNGKTWKIKFKKWLKHPHFYGLCNWDEKTIYIRPKSKNMQDTVIHEVLHAAIPQFSEDAICRTANAIDQALRKTKKKRKRK